MITKELGIPSLNTSTVEHEPLLEKLKKKPAGAECFDISTYIAWVIPLKIYTNVI